MPWWELPRCGALWFMSVGFGCRETQRSAAADSGQGVRGGLVRSRRANFDSRMPPCHTRPFLRPGVVITTTHETDTTPRDAPAAESCDYCGSPRLEWRKCKLICADCRQINKSCADP